MNLHKPESALLIVAHGSTENPDSSDPTYIHADAIRKKGCFAEVHCAFWKEDPSMREAYYLLESQEIYVVPNFISEGYFTQEVIPRELNLEGRTSRVGQQKVYYCDPVGIHPSMTALLLQRAQSVAPHIPPEECSLLIVGHGTGLNQNSTKSIKNQVDLIKATKINYREVLDTYMEEDPLITDWHTFTSAPHVVVVPFFISDGLHSYQDIPVLLGIEKEPTPAASQRDIFRHNPHSLHNRLLYYSSAIGTDPHIAEVILDQVRAFDKQYLSP